MNRAPDRMKAVMIVSGLLTATMIQAAFDPEGALRSTFGEGLQGPLAGVVVRNWAILVALIGALLVYGAYRPATRRPILAAAGASKLAFIALVLSQGTRYLGQPVSVALAVDAVMIAIFAAALARGEGSPLRA